MNINNINEIELVEPQPFNFKANYFYQNLTQNELVQISNFLNQSLQNSFLSQNELSIFFKNFPNLTRGSQNLTKIIQILNELTTNKSNINSYKLIINFLINNFFMVKPSIFQVYFFPNPSNEIHVINMISTCKKTLDICVFTINSKNFYEAIKNLYERNIKIRIITDDEMAKNPTSNIYSLAALGIPVKTDDNPRYYMHHKFAVIDNSVVITGSFNWTNQAINHNQENVLFIENKDLAKKYSDEFDRIWNSFIVSISKQNAIIKCKEDEEKKKAIEKRKLIEKENKLKEKYGYYYVKYLKKDGKKKNNNNNNFVNHEFYNKINYEQNIYNYNQNNYNNQFNNNYSDDYLKEKKSNWFCSIF
jgi:phosphatidylserine/phosphatidylglycerophosphate/cardiolipin synthase-like enzyme